MPLPERTSSPPAACPTGSRSTACPLEDEFGHDPERLEREIRITVLHELGHYFGIDEDRIAELGYE